MKSDRVNVLLLFPDQWRPDWTPSNTTLPLKLPNLKQLIEQGTHFTRAITPAPVCAPARACFALGIDYDSCPVKNNGGNLPPDKETFYAKLRTAGYHVMSCGKLDLAKGASDWGVDGSHPLPNGKTRIEEWGFTSAVDSSGKWAGEDHGRKGNYCPHTRLLHERGLLQTHLDDYAKRHDTQWTGYRYTLPTPLPDDAYADNFVAGKGLSLLQAVPTEEPWFLQVNFSGPHDPMDVTESMWKSWQQTDFPAPVNGDPSFSASEHTAIRRNYAAMLQNIDRWIGVYRREIERRGETDRTVIIFSSDHGEMLGDHGLWAKTVPYQASLGIPLVVAGPGFKSGVENASPVNLIDLTATILDVAGCGSQFRDGRSFVPILKGKVTSIRQVTVSGLMGWHAAFDGRWKLIRGFRTAKGRKTPEEAPPDDLLFDLEQDPNELVNIAADRPDIVARLEPFLKIPKTELSAITG